MKIPKTKYEDTEIEIGKWEDGDVGTEDHGLFTMRGHFDYDGMCQGLGYCIDHTFIMNFIKAFGVEKLSECNGK